MLMYRRFICIIPNRIHVNCKIVKTRGCPAVFIAVLSISDNFNDYMDDPKK